MPWRGEIMRFVSEPVRGAVAALSGTEAARTTEIRAHLGGGVRVVLRDGVRHFDGALSRAQMDDLVAALCGHCVYAHEEQMARGYIPLPGGHRAGLCGRVTTEMEGQARMSGVTSVCIRIARSVPGASRPVRAHLPGCGGVRSTLLIGPPGCGKTTVLRDAALWLARSRAAGVGVCDEREELFPGGSGGAGLDVVSGTTKADAVLMLVRSMAPQVIVTDEIGREADAQALLEASGCGVGLLASAHGDSISGAMRRPAVCRLIGQHAFDRVILLGGMGACAAVYDGEGKRLREDGYGQYAGGGAGDGSDQRDGLLSGGGRKAAGWLAPCDAQMSSAHEGHDPLREAGRHRAAGGDRAGCDAAGAAALRDTACVRA